MGEGEFRCGDAVVLDVGGNVLACPELAEGWCGAVAAKVGSLGCGWESYQYNFSSPRQTS